MFLKLKQQIKIEERKLGERAILDKIQQNLALAAH